MERGQGSDKKYGKENNDRQSLMDKEREIDETITKKRKQDKGR